MSGVLQQLRDYGQWADSVADPRTKGWFLMSSPLGTYTLVALYLALTYYGPRFMASRKALDLKTPMLVYNFALVVLSAYMFKEFFVTTFLNPKFNISCEAVDYSEDPMSVRLAGACWWFFFSKIIELLDTVIFILRKKNNQVSFLHVYHHATMPLLWWIGVRWIPGGASFFSGMVNCSIHVLMYGYYFLSALGPWIQPYLWWKKYLTSLQLIQFFTVLIHCVFVKYQQCGFPDGYIWALIAYLISHIVLFSNFYNQRYRVERESGVPDGYIWALIAYLISHIVLFSNFYNRAYVVKGKKGQSKKTDGQVGSNGSETPGRNGRYNLRERPPKTPYKE